MDEKFALIKEEYASQQKNMLLNGKLPVKDTGVGLWGGANIQVIFEAFKKIGIHNYNNFLDLGSGDGRIVLTASLFGIKAAGIEYDKELFQKSIITQKKLNIPQALFYNNDFHEHSLAGFDLIFLNPDKPLERGLEKKMLKEMTGKLILYGHHFHPRQLKKESELLVGGSLISIYEK